VSTEPVSDQDLGVAKDRRDAEELTVVYDGMCPFCTRFVQLYRIRQLVGRVRLVDAVGMAVKWRGRLYHGPDAMHILALLGAEGTAFGRINRALFARPALARWIYPGLVAGRRLTLRLLGRRLIGDA